MRRGLYDLLDGSQPCRWAPNLFFPGKSDRADTKRAKALCRGCRFQSACLQYALAFDLHGTWGGATRQERQDYQRAAGMHPEPVTIPAEPTARPDKKANR